MREMTDIEKVKQGGENPWRRLFARGFDYWFYFALWSSVSNLIMIRNMMDLAILNLVVAVVLMLILEPILLTIFGTTPGKALFGVRLRNLNGRKLTLMQGWIRMWSVFIRGHGFLFPGYNLYRMYKSYEECKVRGVTKWDEQGDFVVSAKPRNAFILIAACIASVFIGLAAMSVTHFAADMPQHRGELTLQQFQENMDFYWRFHGLPWHDRRPRQAGESPWEPGEQPPEIYITTNVNGFVNEVGIKMIDADIDDLWILVEWIRALLVNFVGAQDGVNFYRMHFGDGVMAQAYLLVAGLPYQGSVNDGFIAYGVEVRFTFDGDLESGIMNAHFNMSRI